jgi:hypothetical protein
MIGWIAANETSIKKVPGSDNWPRQTRELVKYIRPLDRDGTWGIVLLWRKPGPLGHATYKTQVISRDGVGELSDVHRSLNEAFADFEVDAQWPSRGGKRRHAPKRSPARPALAAVVADINRLVK